MADYPQDRRALSAEELQRLFAFASSGKLNTTCVIKNLIWQAYTAIRDGDRASIAGNLDQRGHDVPVATQTRLSFDMILPLWGRRGPR